jgi:hypothetical protein
MLSTTFGAATSVHKTANLLAESVKLLKLFFRFGPVLLTITLDILSDYFNNQSRLLRGQLIRAVIILSREILPLQVFHQAAIIYVHSSSHSNIC